MFSIALVLLFYSFSLFGYSDCYMVPRGVIRSDISQIIYNYVKPLAEKFPNHELEVQFDLLAPPLHPIRVPHKYRRKAYLHKPHKNLRVENDIKTPEEWKKIQTLDNVGLVAQESQKSSQQPSVANSETTQRDRIAVEYTLDETKVTFRERPTVSTTMPTPRTTTAAPKVEKTTSNERQPVYKDELQRALEDLEKRLTKNLLKGSGVDTDDMFDSQVIISNPGPVNDEMSNDNINKIIDLIKKGVQFQRHLPAPGEDSNMEWMQIKIPKNLQQS